MARPAFYNDNANRAYPFVDSGPLEMFYSGGGSKILPDGVVVEFNSILGPEILFVENTHRIYLFEVRRAGSVFTFVFRASAPLLDGYDMTFCRSVDDVEFAVASAKFAAESATSLSSLPCGGVVGEGWLTTGDLSGLVGILGEGEFIRRADGAIHVEPARVQSMRAAFARSFNMANEDRTKATSPDVCSSASLTQPNNNSKSIIVNSTCVAGRVWVKSGYNCDIRQNLVDNSLTIGAFIGRGEGEPCSEVPLFTGEPTQPDSTLLGGGPTCDDVIKTINGVAGPRVNISGGRGVQVLPSTTDPHTLVIDVDLAGLAVCLKSAVSSESLGA